MTELGDELRNMYYQEDWELTMDGGTKLPQSLVGTINEFSLLSKEIIKPLSFEQNKNLFDRIQGIGYFSCFERILILIDQNKVETELRSVLAEALCQFPKTLAELAKNDQAEADGGQKSITGRITEYFLFQF